MRTVACFVTVLVIGLLVSSAHAQVAPPEEPADGGVRDLSDGLVEALGGPNTDIFYCTIETSDGDVVAVGYTTSFGVDGKDVFLVRFDAWGDVIWKRTLGDDDDEVGRSVIETQDGGLVLTGYTESFGGGGRNLLLSKFDSDGTHDWSTVLSRTDGVLEFDGYAVIEDPNGDLVVTGEVERQSPLQHRMLYAKFDSSGGLIHKKSIYNLAHTGWNLYGYSLARDSGGRHLLVGKVDYGADEDVLLVMMRSSATVEWGWIIGNEGINEEARSIIETSGHGYAFTGAVGDDCFLYTLDSDLALDWAKRGEDSNSKGYSVVETEDGFVVTGSRTDTTTDVLLARWEPPAGSLAWSRSIGGDGYDIGRSIEATASGRLWVAGWTSSWGVGGSDGLLAMFQSDGTTCMDDLGGVGSVTWDPDEDPLYGLTAFNPPETQAIEWGPTIGDPNLTMTVVCPDDPPPPPGACCFDDGSCQEVEGESACDDLSGSYRGDGTICHEPQACCFDDGTCLDADPWCCHFELGGTVKPVPNCLGDDTNPPPSGGNGIDDACEPPWNSLCENATVITTLPHAENLWYRLAESDVDVSCNHPDCDYSPHGVWWRYQPMEDRTIRIEVSGDYTATAIFTGDDYSNLTEVYCSDSETSTYRMTGGNEYWIMVSKYYCGVLRWPPDPVEISFSVRELDGIPTMSEWGMIIMTLLLLTAGTVVFGRRRAAAAA